MTRDEMQALTTGCAYPIIFDARNEFAPYMTKGTSFLVEYQSQWYVITAGHCVASQGRKTRPEDILIASAPVQLALPLSDVVGPFPENVLCEHDVDIAVCSVSMDVLTDEVARSFTPFRLTEDTVVLEDRQVGTLRITGYPATRSSIDYEAGEIRHELVVLNGEQIWAHSEVDIGVEFRPPFNTNEVRHPDGFSGSPVFDVVASHPNYSVKLAGMLVTGCPERGTFISARLILRLLRLWAIEQSKQIN